MAHVKVCQTEYEEWKRIYTLKLTNFEIKVMFRHMVKGWFSPAASSYSDFIKAFLQGNLDAMNEYINRVTRGTFSYFDTAGDGEHAEPEKFYHGFMIGLMVELSDRYRMVSNRESGFGRCDMMLIPRKKDLDAVIIEFKVYRPHREKSLEETAENALAQIEERDYIRELTESGIPREKIRIYGFAFRGKEVLIKAGNID